MGKIHSLSSSTHKNSGKQSWVLPTLDECLGTFILVFWTIFLCWLLTIAQWPGKNWYVNGAEDGVWWIFSIVFAVTYIPLLFFLIIFLGRGGAHFNPAVTLGLWAAKKINWNTAWKHILSQFTGCVFAGLLLFIIAGATTHSALPDQDNQWTNPTLLGITTIKPSITNVFGTYNDATQTAGVASQAIGWLIEFTGFALFFYLILNVQTISQKICGKHTKNNSKKISYISAFILSVALCLVIFVELPFTGASLNPCRSLAPVMFQSWGDNGAMGWQYMWVYGSAPVIGSLVSAGIYNITYR